MEPRRSDPTAESAKFPEGSALAERQLPGRSAHDLVADSAAALIWRVDLPEDGSTPLARVWLRHESMGYYPGEMKPEQPGINGVRYAAKLGYLYYTGCAKKLFMRVKVDAETLDAIGEPEHVAVGRVYDDFCIDESAGVAYLTTHRENTIDCVSLNPGRNTYRFIVAGDPLNEELIGPSSAAWGRLPGDYGKVAFVTTDGGTAWPPSRWRATVGQIAARGIPGAAGGPSIVVAAQ